MRTIAPIILVLPLVLPGAVAAQLIKIPAHLTPATSQAFDKYVAAAEAKMDWKPRRSGKSNGDVEVAALGGSPVSIEDGMIHDWAGGVLIKGGTVDKALAMFQNYSGYKKVFSPEVLDSRLVSRDGNLWNTQLRISRRNVFTVTFDVEYSVEYRPLGDGRWVIRSRSTRLRELDDDNKPLPEGTGQGFLWRMNSYWLIEPRREGLYLECRAISLSRDVPTGLGWIARPFISTVPRDSLKATVEEARNALR